MKRSKFTEAKIAFALKQAESGTRVDSFAEGGLAGQPQACLPHIQRGGIESASEAPQALPGCFTPLRTPYFFQFT